MSRAEIEAVLIDFVKAFNNHDAAALATFYTADARMLPPNAPMITGPAAIQAMVQEMFDAGAQSLELETVDVLEGGDLQVEVGRYTMVIQPPGAELIQDVGKYIAVFRRQPDGGLKLVADTFNSDAPAPAG